MTRKFKPGARALDAAAAAVLAAAVAYSGAALGSFAMAAFLAPPAFVSAFALLGKVADEPVHRLAGFELQAVDIPQRLSAVTDDDANVVRLFERTDPSGGAPVTETGGDAGRALSEALAALRRSLR